MAEEARLERAAEALERAAGSGLDRGAELYDRFAGPIREQMKFIASNVPVAGALVSALDDVLGARAAAIREERVHELLRMTVEFSKAVDESKLDRDFLGSPAWNALVEGAVIKAARTWQEDKRRMFAQFLTNAARRGYAPGYRERLLNVIDGLGIGHVIALQAVAGWSERLTSLEGLLDTRRRKLDKRPLFVEAFPGMTFLEALGFLADLAAARLIRENGEDGIIDEKGQEIRITWFLATSQGFEILDFISSAGPLAEGS